MNSLEEQECNLNIRYDLPQDILSKVELVYTRMPGWLGYGKKGMGYEGFPYWFSYNEEEKYIFASVEPDSSDMIARKCFPCGV